MDGLGIFFFTNSIPAGFMPVVLPVPNKPSLTKPYNHLPVFSILCIKIGRGAPGGL